MKTRIQHPEYRIQKVENAPRGKVAAGGTGFTFGTMTRSGRDVGKWCSFSHFETRSSRLFPHKSTQVVDFPRICALSVFRKDKEEPLRYGGTERSGAWNQYSECGGRGIARKICGFLRIFPRFSMIFRTDQGRIYAILRIFTGKAYFLETSPRMDTDGHGSG